MSEYDVEKLMHKKNLFLIRVMVIFVALFVQIMTGGVSKAISLTPNYDLTVKYDNGINVDFWNSQLFVSEGNNNKFGNNGDQYALFGFDISNNKGYVPTDFTAYIQGGKNNAVLSLFYAITDRITPLDDMFAVLDPLLPSQMTKLDTVNVGNSVSKEQGAPITWDLNKIDFSTIANSPNKTLTLALMMDSSNKQINFFSKNFDNGRYSPYLSMGQGSSTNPSPVPEPSSLLFGALALSCLLVQKKK